MTNEEAKRIYAKNRVNARNTWGMGPDVLIEDTFADLEGSHSYVQLTWEQGLFLAKQILEAAIEAMEQDRELNEYFEQEQQREAEEFTREDILRDLIRVFEKYDIDIYHRSEESELDFLDSRKNYDSIGFTDILGVETLRKKLEEYERT